MERQNGVNGTANGSANGHEPKMLSLEIEVADDAEEHQSLLREMISEEVPNGSDKKQLFMGRNAHGMRRRGWGTEDGLGHDSKAAAAGTGTSLIQGFLRSELLSHAVYHLRNALVLGVLAFFVLLVLDWEGGVMRSEVMEEEDPVAPHMWSYGGKYNLNHALEPFKKWSPLSADEEADLEDEILDEATETIGTWDLAIQNKLNEEAHYLHDPEKSPFASNLYNANDDELDDRQVRFATRMQEVAEKWGVWNNPNYEEAFGPEDSFFEEYYYRDVPVEEFPYYTWQTDREYIQSFLDEAQSLVEAVKEGIMHEYNHPNPDDDEKDLFGVIIGDHHEFINGTAHHSETKKRLPGVAFLPEKAWNGLVRKLLHAMITSDHFYVVVAGTEETYKANNFAKTQVMQFNYIMEPVFHKLGMTLISRNMGMSANTAVSALGGADILGETDILWHVQRLDTEEKPGEFDLLQKQAIMSGERVPIVFSPQWDELMEASKGKAWVGNIQPGVDFCEKTTMDVLPDAPACHNVHCDTAAWESRQCYVYDSVCWEVREGWNPDTQADDAGDQDKDYPGYRRHQLEGRKMTLLLLHAMNAAIEQWRSQLDDDRSPLPLSTELWHVGGIYEDIRESVMSLERTPGEIGQIPACEMLLKEVDARICHVPMHAFTEWTPRVVPAKSGLVSIINNLVTGAEDNEELYEGPDILPLAWRLPDDEVDVHMIAIAANVTPQYDDDVFGGMYLDDDWGYWDQDFNETDDMIRFLTVEEEEPYLRKLQGGGNGNGDNVKADSDKRKGKKKKKNKKNGGNKNPQDKPSDQDNQEDNNMQTQQQEPGNNSVKNDNNNNGNGAAKQKKGKGKGKGKGKKNGSDNKNASANGGAKPVDPMKVYSGEWLELAEGSGWRLEDAPVGFCDGSAQSRCNRNVDNTCLLANHNHYKGNIVGGPKNNWLTMRVPVVKHGIILARIAFEASDGSANVPSDLLFDYAVNGVVKTIKGPELDNFIKTIVSDLKVIPLVDARDEVLDGEDFGEGFDIGFRIRSFVDPNCVMRLSHIYYA